MARFFFVVIVVGTVVLIGAFVFVAFTLYGGLFPCEKNPPA
jgi:hypothetical protein